MSCHCQSNVQSNRCPVCCKYGIPTALALILTSALYYGYKWYMAKPKSSKPDLDKTLVTGTVPNSPVIDQPLDNKE
jgi:hypothetical protein